MTAAISILLADDHAAMRRGTRAILESDSRLYVVAEAANGEEAVALNNQLAPNVLVMDVQLPIISGIEVVRRVRLAGCGAAILMLSAYDDTPYVLSALRAGATGYLLKTAEPQELIDAVHHVLTGQMVLGHDISMPDSAGFGALPRTSLTMVGVTKPAASMREQLSTREREVLRLVAQGFTNKVIAAEMHISDRTVQVHIANIFVKLGATTRTDAAMIALRYGLVTLP